MGPQRTGSLPTGRPPLAFRDRFTKLQTDRDFLDVPFTGSGRWQPVPPPQAPSGVLRTVRLKHIREPERLHRRHQPS